MSMNNKVPEIRFKGFSGEWVDSDLKSFSDSFSYGLNASAVKFDGVNKYLRITDIDEKSRRFDYCQLTSPDADLSKSDNYLLKNGDILFARTGASVGKTYIYNEQDGKVYFAGFLIRASINHKASAQFIFQNTQTHEYARFVAATSQRSGQPGINAKEYGEYRLFSPTEPEQIAIGNYFQKLDALINQHQQKHDKLSSIKKAMLEKVFPKSGETIPEIRFKGFSGEWDEVTLSSVIDVRSGKDYKHLGKGYIPVYGTGGYMHSVDSALSNDKDAIGIGRKGTIDKPYILRAPFWTVDTLFYAVPFTNFNLDFLFCLFQKIDWKKHDESTGVPSLSKIAINNLPVYTTNKLEQTAIGNYFQKLDSLINQHQQQITKLNNIKQACLSKMFV